MDCIAPATFTHTHAATVHLPPAPGGGSGKEPLTGDFDVAEEAVQEVFASAVQEWPAAGLPHSPRAWIIQTARHKAIDRLRRQVSGRWWLLHQRPVGRRESQGTRYLRPTHASQASR
jgi:DNA-directed RNA polymerase specialized sigma24 family protein